MRVLMILPALTEATSPFWRPIKYSLFPPLGLATLAGYLSPEDDVRIIDEHGMNAAITYLESWGIPVVPSERDIENVERWIGSIVDGLQRLGRQTQTLIDASYEAALKKDEKAKKSRLFFWLHFLTK